MSTFLLYFTIALVGISAPLQESPEETRDLADLLKDLTSLTSKPAETESEKLAEQFQERIKLADEILVHPDVEESQRVFAELTKLQAFGFLYAIDQREKKNDAKILSDYQTQIDRLLTDSNERISLEAISANANLATNRYVKQPDTDTSETAVSALKKLVEIAPKDPIIQTTKRLLLERVWNSDQPKPLFEALAKTDDPSARIVLPSLADESDSSSREKAEFQWAKYFAKFNDFVAMNRLAEMYEQGKGTRANNTQSARWYEKLARLGDLNSLTKLGDFYLAGKGYSENPETAVEYYQKAATAGYRVAQFKLGECFRTGQGTEVSEDDWRKWIKSAAFNASSVEVQKLYESVDFKSSADSFKVFYEVLVDQNPEDIYYMNNLAYSLLIGSKKEPERSLELIDAAIAAAPKNFDGMSNFKDTRAHALKHLGKYKEAAELFESVLNDLDDKKTIMQALVECYAEFDEEKASEYRSKLNELSDE